ncbi:hypothetical protein V8B97DRAFT_1864822 [Scleroderma yunnanense]
MFKASQSTPYDDLVTKATDENLTGEDWETILNLCDKVQDEGEAGARNTIAALLKRLAHRSPNVQLYALSLAEALSKNCGIVLHRELASRVFTQGLERLVTDRTTHDKVRKRALGLIAMWTAEFENDPSLGVMEECYSNLRSKNYRYEAPNEPPPPAVDDEVRRREEEELQRALEMSIHDRGGRNGRASAQTSHVGGSGSGSGAGAGGAGPSTTTTPTYPSGYVPARTPPQATPSTSSLPVQTSPAPAAAPVSVPVVTRVRALHTFEASEPGELAFERGDIIRVVDRAYRDWWRGQLRGRTGIFPVNYVEPLPEPTAAELAREAEQEAAIFAQAANVDQLLVLLRGLDSTGERLADNEEIQELYRSCMTLRPKIVKLIDKYSQKRADLISMNEGFVKARTLFDRMMEESLARHTGGYDPRVDYPMYGRPDSGRPEYGLQSYGSGYPGYEQPPAQGHGIGVGYAEAPHPAQHGQYVPEQTGFPQPNSGYPNLAQSPYPQAQTQAPFFQPQTPFQPAQTPYMQGQAAPPQQIPAQDAVQSQPQPQPQAQMQPQPQTQAQVQSQPHIQVQPQVQPQMAAQVSPQPQQGPPYVYDPNTTYEDPNVQAWAQYYAQGGKDLAGSVYFISVPGVTDAVEGGHQAGGQDQAGSGQQQSSEAAGSPTLLSQQLGPYTIAGTGPTGTSSPQPTGQVQQPYNYVSSQPHSPQQYASTDGYTSSLNNVTGHAPSTSASYGGGYDYGVGALQQQFSDMGVSGVAHQAHMASS